MDKQDQTLSIEDCIKIKGALCFGLAHCTRETSKSIFDALDIIQRVIQKIDDRDGIMNVVDTSR